MTPILRIEGLRHGYGGRSVLELKSLEINAGETLCLMGPNGAGKSTLIRILNLVEKPEAGTIWFDGEPVTLSNSEARRRMAGVFQRPHMFCGSVAENVAYGLKLRRTPAHEISRRVDMALADLGLSHLRDHDARRLSGGEAQRVALARAMALEPDLLFLDEPAGNLDTRAREDLHRDLRHIAMEGETTVVYVTHSVDEAKACGNRVAFLEDGRLRQLGPVREVLDAYAGIYFRNSLEPVAANHSCPVPFSIAILAGGDSSRMGCNKALAPLGGRPLISHAIASLSPHSDDVFIVGGHARDYEQFGLPHVRDQYSLSASLVGIYSAISAARHEFCLVVSCDMPYAPADLARSLAAIAAGYDAVVPQNGKGAEPLFALYSKSCRRSMREHIEAGDLAIRSSLDELKVRRVNLEEAVQGCDQSTAFLNVNTKDDLREARKLLEEPSARKRLDRPGLVPDKLTPGAGSPPALVCFVGKKNSGKTTFLEKLVPLLKLSGLRVAFVKHDVHGFDMDREGSDTSRLSRAGASRVVISSPFAMGSIRVIDNELSLDEIKAEIGSAVDIVIAEGYKSSAADKIEISRNERSTALACPEQNLIAVISDRPDAAKALPVFSLDDVEEVAEFLIERYGFFRFGQVRR